MKTSRTILVLLVPLVAVVCVHAQRKPAPKPSPKPIITLGATTDDGKRVVLKSDGTWDYDTTASITPPKPMPAPTPEPVKEKYPATIRTAVEAVIKGLRRIGSAVEVGITLSEYNTRLIDVKADADEQFAAIPDGEIKSELQSAIEAYVDAQNAWGQMGRHDTLFPSIEPGRSLMVKYSIPIDRSIGMELLPGNSVRSIIWRAAKTHVDRAAQFLNAP
jgi:hypothetical protein